MPPIKDISDILVGEVYLVYPPVCHVRRTTTTPIPNSPCPYGRPISSMVIYKYELDGVYYIGLSSTSPFELTNDRYMPGVHYNVVIPDATTLEKTFIEYYKDGWKQSIKETPWLLRYILDTSTMSDKQVNDLGNILIDRPTNLLNKVKVKPVATGDISEGGVYILNMQHKITGGQFSELAKIEKVIAPGDYIISGNDTGPSNIGTESRITVSSSNVKYTFFKRPTFEEMTSDEAFPRRQQLVQLWSASHPAFQEIMPLRPKKGGSRKQKQKRRTHRRRRI